MIEFAISSLIIVIFCFLIIYSSLTWLKNKKLSVAIEQAIIDREVALNFAAKQVHKEFSDELEAKDAFIKFLSESRDWSFAYIEDTQKAVGKFVSDIEPEINYFDEYGIVSSAWPHYYSMKKISESYKQLKQILPDDYGKLDK